MTTASPTKRMRIGATWTLFASLCFIASGSIVGCGDAEPQRVTPPGSDTSESNSAIPNSSNSESATGSSATGSSATGSSATGSIDAESTGSIEAPGGMELPSNLQDSPTDDKEPSQDAGIEMPADLSSNPSDSDNGDQSNSPQVRYANWESLQAEIRSAGRPSVIDLWSLSCRPCMEEFPGLVSLNNDLGDQVQCIAVNVDFDGRKRRPPKYYEPRVQKFLNAVKAGDLTNIICETASDEVYQLADVASLPSVLIYDSTGALVKKFVDAGETAGFGYENDVRPFVESMLASRSN